MGLPAQRGISLRFPDADTQVFAVIPTACCLLGELSVGAGLQPGVHENYGPAEGVAIDQGSELQSLCENSGFRQGTASAVP
jgi:hypothetical protein